MPQASRTGARGAPAEKDAVAKAQEQEFKRARGAISCAECRRLKLKCDKTVPCGSCKRRGCESICPNGSLTTGQGTRFILADTDRLHRKISEMSDRIRQLEDALSIMQSAATREVHPLLRVDLLKIKSGLELHSAINQAYAPGGAQTDEEMDAQSQDIDAFGTLAVSEDGAATFYGRSAGSESLLLDERPGDDAEASSALDMNAFHPQIEALASAFPSASSGLADTATLQSMIIEHLPEWRRASRLCELYLEQAPWFFGAITRRQLLEELLPLFYGEAMNSPGMEASAHSSPDSDSSPAPTLMVSSSAFARPANATEASAHDLALLFVVFCFGALTDPALPPAPNNAEASTYYQLTRAALNLEPVLDRPPSIATVQTLSLMGIYQGLVADERSIESTWALMGLSCKLAQSIGLHRDSARWKLSPSEVQKRRALFWELFITDCWQALATGRLPSFSLPYVDTELPADPDQTLADDGTAQPSFPAWKALWGKECVATVVDITLTSRAPKYSLILELDRKIRDMELPKYAMDEPPKNASMSETMKHFMPINYRELTLLYVHRCFFAQALADHPKDPLKSQYAPSFLAGYRSACALIATVREQFHINPVQIARFWVLWTHAFSSSVMLASVVTHGGTTKTAQAALVELRLAANLFEQAARYGGRAVKFLPIVRRLHQKAHQIYGEGYQKPVRDIFAPRDAEKDRPDELSIFSGRTRTVNSKASKPPTRHRSVSRRRIPLGTNSPSTTDVSSPGSATGSGSGSGSGSARLSQSPTVSTPSDTMPDSDIPSLASYGSSVHPMLIDDMRSFEGQLDTQIYNAQREFTMVDSSSMESRSAADLPNGYGRTPSDSYYQPPVEYHQRQDADPRYGYQSMAPPPVPSHAQQPGYHHEHHHEHHSTPSTLHYPSHHTPQEPVYHTPAYGSGESTPSSSTAQAQSYIMAHPVGHHGTAPGYPTTPSHSHDPYWGVPSSSSQYPPPPGAPPGHSTMYYDNHQAPQMQSHIVPSQPVGYTAYQPPPPQVPAASRAPSAHSQPPVIPVQAGGYSLQETWTSFMQHQLPAPPAQQRFPVQQR